MTPTADTNLRVSTATQQRLKMVQAAMLYTQGKEYTYNQLLDLLLKPLEQQLGINQESKEDKD